jgi:predicted nucleic-acid-binding protein
MTLRNKRAFIITSERFENGKNAKTTYRVRSGNRVDITAIHTGSPNSLKETLRLDLLHAEAHRIANKPGLASQEDK